MEKKVKYTREEKIKYYSLKVAKAQLILDGLNKRLERVLSPDYQDWDDSVTKQIKNKKAKSA